MNIHATATAVPASPQPDPFEEALASALELHDERTLDPHWSQALAQVREYALRPAKRVRPALLQLGYALTGAAPSRGVTQFAVGLELLHTFMLVHDDVADRAQTRRGGPALHLSLGRGRQGEDLAIVLGDHLFARSVELMVGSGLPGSAAAAQHMMAVCRHTAAGQFLDLQLSTLPLASVTLFQAIKVAQLKTARYGFVAPLVCGALLGNGTPQLREALERVGRQAGVAFQLRDDLIGLFGDEKLSGKSAAGDYLEGKRTFPVIAAWTRGGEGERAVLEDLWARPRPDLVDEARRRVEALGGKAATERVIARATAAAQRALGSLPDGAARQSLGQLLARLERRSH